MIGTSITGFLQTLGGHGLTFFVAAGLSVAASIIIACVKIPRRDAAHRGTVSARSVLAIFRRRDVRVPSFTNALCQFMYKTAKATSGPASIDPADAPIL
jgi:predicted MFS family arabinose efflux permease